MDIGINKTRLHSLLPNWCYSTNIFPRLNSVKYAICLAKKRKLVGLLLMSVFGLKLEGGCWLCGSIHARQVHINWVMNCSHSRWNLLLQWKCKRLMNCVAVLSTWYVHSMKMTERHVKNYLWLYPNKRVVIQNIYVCAIQIKHSSKLSCQWSHSKWAWAYCSDGALLISWKLGVQLGRVVSYKKKFVKLASVFALT